MSQIWILIKMIDRIKTNILSKIMHPSPCLSFFNHIFFNNIFNPNSCIRIYQIDSSKVNTQTSYQIRRSILIFDEISILYSLLKVVLSNKSLICYIRKIWIDIYHWFDSIFSPFLNRLSPIRISTLIKLPIPNKSITFNKMLYSNPILHPKSSHFNLVRFKILIF